MPLNLRTLWSDSSHFNMKKKFKTGDQVKGTDRFRWEGEIWYHIYDILAIENKLRFGRPAQLLTVRRSDSTGHVIEDSEKRWSTQLF